MGEGDVFLFIFKWKEVSSSIWHVLKKSENWALRSSWSELQLLRTEEIKKCNWVSFVNYDGEAVM